MSQHEKSDLYKEGYHAGQADAVRLDGDARECLMDVISHHGDFRTACLEVKASNETSRSDESYWQKQIDVLDRMKAQAERALAAPASAVQAEAVRVGWVMVPNHANADAIVTSLYRRFKDWSKRGLGPDDVTWCEVKADVLAMLAASPAAPAQSGKSVLPAWFDTFMTNVCEIPDRNSPEDEPEAIVATLEELKSCALNAIEQCDSIPQPSQPAQAADDYNARAKNWRDSFDAMHRRAMRAEARVHALSAVTQKPVAWENPSTFAILRDESPDMCDLRRREWRPLVYANRTDTVEMHAGLVLPKTGEGPTIIANAEDRV